MIPTIIEYLIILFLILCFFPLGFYLIAKIPFLGMEVTGYLPAAGFLLISIAIRTLFSLLANGLLKLLAKFLKPLAQRRDKVKTAFSIIFLAFILKWSLNFLGYHLADMWMESVNLHIVTKIVLALFTIPTFDNNEKKDKNTKEQTEEKSEKEEK